MPESKSSLISAETARKLTEDHEKQTTRVQLDKVNFLVVAATKAGKCVAVLPERLTPDAVKIVTQLGYRYEAFYDQRDDETFIHITW